MDPKDFIDRLRAQLERERDRQPRGRREIDKRMGHSAGWLTRKTGKDFTLKVTELARALAEMGVEPGEFFGEAFDILPRPEELLRRQEKPGPPAESLARIEAAARALEAESEEPPTPDTAPVGTAPTITRSRDEIESLVRSRLSYQRDRLREEDWARDPANLGYYLEQLDALRSDRADDSASLAETVAVEIVPLVSCSQERRFELLCQAIGVFASGQRVRANFATAARGIGLGLSLANRHRLSAARPRLLQRGAYVLRDTGFRDHALRLLDEAQNLWFELDSPADYAKALIERANVLWYGKAYRRAELIFRKALELLESEGSEHRLYRLAAAHGIAFSRLKMGHSVEAKDWMDRATELLNERDTTALGKMIWQKGAFLYNQGEMTQAELAFSGARKILERKENPIQGALVALDLAAALHGQGKVEELRQLAEEMTALLRFFDDNRIAQAALMAFIRAGCDGKVTERLIAEVGKKLGRAQPLLRQRPDVNQPPGSISGPR